MVDQTLRELNLSNNPVKAEGVEYLVSSLRESTRLVRLNLTNTELGTRGIQKLESLLQHHPSLEEIRLGKNALKGKHAVKPIFLGCRENAQLRILDLSDNQLNDACVKCLADLLHSRTCQCRLVELDLSNQLDDLPNKGNCITAKGVAYIQKALIEGNNTTLKTLKLSGNNLGEEGGKALGGILQLSHSLEELHLAGCHLGNGGIQYICQGLENAEKAPVLHYLDVSWNRLHKESAEHLAHLLECSTTLRILKMRKTGIGDDSAVTLARALPLSFAIEELDIGENLIRDNGAVALATALKKFPRDRELQLLWDMNTLMTEDGQHRLAGAMQLRKSRVDWLDKLLDQVIKGCSHLNCKLGDDELLEICKGVASTAPRLYNLSMVRLEGSMITRRGVASVANSLLIPPRVQLKKLFFVHTRMGDRGAELLAQAMVQDRALITLTCQDCDLTDDGARYLSRAIRRHQNLTRLDLGQNFIASEGARAILEAAADVPSLETLILCSNQIQDSALTAAVSAGCLSYLNLTDNQLTDVGALELANCYNHSVRTAERKLKWLSIGQNCLTIQGVQALANVCVSLNAWPQKTQS